MTQQITTYKNVEFPISHMFNNVRCSKRGYLMNISRPTQIIAHLADSFYVPELDVFVFLDKTHMVCNEWKYQSKDNQTTITFSGFELHMNYATFSDTYREQCIQQYIENGELDVRRNKLNVEMEIN